MASCKDCLHVEVCEEYGEVFSLIKGGKCSLFKDRSQLVELPTHLSVSERFEKCSQELINIAKCSETPSRILRIIGENFIELANGYEAVERKAEQALKEREENAN